MKMKKAFTLVSGFAFLAAAAAVPVSAEDGKQDDIVILYTNDVHSGIDDSIGYDGLAQGDYYNPRLTTVRQPVEEMARVTIEHLFEMIEGNADPKDIIMPAELQVKASSGKAKV